MNYGFKPEPVVVGKDFFGGSYGSLGGQDINPDGDWRPYAPLFEPQNVNGTETYACTVFGTNSCVETLAQYQWGIELNLSDRFLAKVSGLDGTEGQSPQNAAEWLRKVGAPCETDWPFSQDYFAAVQPKLFDLAKSYFYNPYDFKHEYIGTDVETRKKYLKKSPLGRSVSAWIKEGDFYVSNGMPNNHWVMEVFIGDDYSLIFDSYDKDVPFKKLRLDHECQVAKRYQLNKRNPKDLTIVPTVFETLKKKGLLAYFMDWFDRFMDSTQKPV